MRRGFLDPAVEVSGNAQGPTLFMNGKLKIEGDVAFAAMMQSMFKIPTS